VPLYNFVPRGFGFVHHSIAILYHQVPNLSITIRLFHRNFLTRGRGGSQRDIDTRATDDGFVRVGCSLSLDFPYLLPEAPASWGRRTHHV
jgi:hypothetical protein